MIIETTTGSNKYITKSTRSKFHAIEWLGLVHNERGTGQLARNTITGQYIMFINQDLYFVLDTAAVTAAMAVSRPRRGPGRPPSAVAKVKVAKVSKLPMRHHMISLPDDLALAVRALGNGNLSAGVRMCCTICTATSNVTTAPISTDTAK